MIALLQFAGNQSVLNPHGPVSGWLARMSWIFMGYFGAVWVLTMLILMLALWRGVSGQHLGDIGSRRLVLIGGLGVPIATFVTFLIYSVTVGQRLDAKPYADKGALTVVVKAKQWWWEFDYMDHSRLVAPVPNELHIPVGQPVVLKLEAPDVIHSFWVPNLAGKTDLIPGRTNQLWLQADKPGVFRGQCAEYCGEQHAHMQFEVVAEDPAQFKEWLQQQARPAVEPSNPQEAQGRQVFLSGPCSMCHAIRGTQALAQVGPDLTHMATRRWIAAGTLPNNRGSRGGWIVNAQGIKPGNHMPRLNLESNDLQALLDYLASLQ